MLRTATHSPLLPKVVSLVAYAGLLGFAYWISRINRLALALIFVLVGPFAVRWLTDGMETSLACLLAVTFSVLLYQKASPAALVSIAFTLSLLRVDMTFLVAFGVILLLDQKEWLRAASLCVGSGLSLAFILVTMGHLLPDTAVAKEGLRFVVVISSTAHEIVATFSFGIGVILVWIVSAELAWRIDRRTTVICNLPFPLLVLLAAVKGQQMHGVRYVIWAILFSITWNLLQTKAVPQRRPIFLTAFAGALVVCWFFELPMVLRVDRGRSDNLYAMEQAHLEQLSGQGIAGDVGFIGYFSQAPICDLLGLVNGRTAARKSDAQRSQACVDAKPSFLFLSASQIKTLDKLDHLNSQMEWLECGSVDFTNVNSTDRHFLLVRRTEYPKGCPTHL